MTLTTLDPPLDAGDTNLTLSGVFEAEDISTTVAQNMPELQEHICMEHIFAAGARGGAARAGSWGG